ncbi:MAG: efflux RND transporter periplasmic adaptor subunit [Hyphomonas sp.]
MGRLIAIIAPIAILLVLGVGGVFAITAMKPEPEKSDEPQASLNVFAEQIRSGSLTITVEAQGEVSPKREIIVAPQIAGRVSYVSPDFVDGGFIKRGQVLVRVEAADSELGVVRARSIVASAEQALAREIAEAQLAQQDLDNLGLSDASPLARREPQLAEARASLEAAKAQLAEAELSLNRTAIIAPFEGRVRERSADIGQFVSPGQSLGNIFATDVVEVALPLKDADLGQLGLPIAFSASADQPGPKVEFTAVVGGKPRTWIGEVVRTGAAINSQTRQINVFAELKDPFGTGADDGAPMAPGLFVNARIQGETLDNVLIAPRAALRGDNRLFIGDPKTSKLSIRSVDVAFSDRDGAYLRSGAEPGELAVTSPIQAAFDGMSVTVLERLPDGTVKIHGEKKTTAETEAIADAATKNGGQGSPQ